MLRAELRHISPNDYPNWEAFAASERPEPWDDFGWFVLDIGLEGQEGTDQFQALITTPAAAARAPGNEHHRRMLVVDSCEPGALAIALKEFVSSVTALTWEEVVKRLQRAMYWEYEKRWS